VNVAGVISRSSFILYMFTRNLKLSRLYYQGHPNPNFDLQGVYIGSKTGKAIVQLVINGEYLQLVSA
jgi:hypothetical protein